MVRIQEIGLSDLLKDKRCQSSNARSRSLAGSAKDDSATSGLTEGVLDGSDGPEGGNQRAPGNLSVRLRFIGAVPKGAPSPIRNNLNRETKAGTPAPLRQNIPTNQTRPFDPSDVEQPAQTVGAVVTGVRGDGDQHIFCI
jgi:hypothetical protein